MACCRCTLSALLQPDVDNEAINAAHEWWDRERRPKPPKPKLSWACVQAVSVVSMEKQDEKLIRNINDYLLTRRLLSCRPWSSLFATGT